MHLGFYLIFTKITAIFIVLCCIFQAFETSHSFSLSASFLCIILQFSSVQFSSVAQSCPTVCDPINRSTERHIWGSTKRVFLENRSPRVFPNVVKHLKSAMWEKVLMAWCFPKSTALGVRPSECSSWVSYHSVDDWASCFNSRSILCSRNTKEAKAPERGELYSLTPWSITRIYEWNIRRPSLPPNK